MEARSQDPEQYENVVKAGLLPLHSTFSSETQSSRKQANKQQPRENKQ